MERIREKLAENIHELWAVTRIEQGWTYGTVSVEKIQKQQHKNIYLTASDLDDINLCVTCNCLPTQFRDDNKKLHPCLVDFQGLPEPERNYNLQMSGETLK